MAKTNAEETTALATQSSAALATFDAGDLMSDMLSDLTPQDIALPYLSIASAQSDIVTPGKDKYNKDVRPGFVYNTVTNKGWEEILIIPCKPKKRMQEWTPETKGTPVGEHEMDSDIVRNAAVVVEEKNGKQVRKIVTPTGNVLQETITYPVVYITPYGKVSQALLPFSKTRLSVAKALAFMIMEAGSTVMTYKLGTTIKTKDGNSWYVHKIEASEPLSPDKYPAACDMWKKLAELSKANLVKAMDIESDLADDVC